MKNKGFIIFITLLISVLCIYYLSFTFIAQGIQKDATEATRDENGNTDLIEKQRYLDSVWTEPVYNFLGMDYTYKEVKETELNLGLDLQGGMHVVLEVSPVDILIGLAGNNSNDPHFQEALASARENIRGTQLNFVDEFYKEFRRIAPENKPLSVVFATSANRDRFDLSSTDDEVLVVINEEVESAIERSFEILRTRIDRFGTSQPNIQRLSGTRRIQIELPGVENPSRVRKLLQGVAKLEFWEVHQPNDYQPVLVEVDQYLARQQKAQKDSDSTSTTTERRKTPEDDLSALLEDEGLSVDVTENDSIVTADDTTNVNLDSLNQSQQTSPILGLLKSPNTGLLLYDLKDTAQINRLLSREDVQTLIPSNMTFAWAVKTFAVDELQEGQFKASLAGQDIIELYVIKVRGNRKPPLTGEVVTDAYFQLDEFAQPGVSMQMNPAGAKQWRKITRENVDRQIAILLDGFVYSAPNVKGEIPNGSSSITGNFTREEALDLANVLKAGALPAPTTIVEDVVIGPTLGETAQNQGINSIVAGLMAVILFMVIYYARGGLVANIALFFNIFFILGILAPLSAALTLPGIAGIVLTIGMSIDANVLIFERIKEELRNGAALKAAISSGYKKAYTSIIDANVTTFITGVLLYVLGQGPVKGFAITLMIGIACSFFSAVFITRVIVERFSRRGEQSRMNFSTAFSRNALANLNVDFLGKRKIAYLISGLFITLGIVAMLTKGIVLGVDFKGGRSYVVSFTDSQIPTQIKEDIEPFFNNQGTEVKTYGADNILKITTSYLIDDDRDEADAKVLEALVKGLQAATGKTLTKDETRLSNEEYAISSSSKVGATIADDIKNSSYRTAAFALIAIFLYILIRFRKWQFGLGAITALFHDTLVVLSAFAIANWFGIAFEADQVFVAAILMIIGYSINDTVVVFDRIRENLGVKAGSEVKRIFNESLNSTISRTMITSITTLFVVIVLFFFGGAALKGFSFALLVGILVGTYSSIFIATPIVIDMNRSKGQS